jgi:predicted amidohydrolase
MDKPIVATVQQQMQVFASQEDYQADVFRYLRMAQSKKASLVVFPALSPTMLVPPLVSSPRLGLMKQADKGRRRWASLKDRLLGRAANAADQALGGGLRGEMSRLLNHAPEALYEAYVDLFSAAALKFKTTIVAGSFYLRSSEEASSKHISFVFGPNGQIIGRQEKIHLTIEEMGFCQAGEELTAIETEVGRIGILINEDALFPESGRLLAYQRADTLVNLAACDGADLFHQTRHAFIARLDENELMGVQSCLVGPNRLTASGQDFVGKSGLLSPITLSPQRDGISFQIGAMTVEGIIAETVDLGAMRHQWESDTPRLRQGMRTLAYRPLSQAYSNMRNLDQVYRSPRKSLDRPGRPERAETPPSPSDTQPSPAPPPSVSTPLSDRPDLTDQSERERRNLNLSGSERGKGFDLLSSPFSDSQDEDDEPKD